MSENETAKVDAHSAIDLTPEQWKAIEVLSFGGSKNQAALAADKSVRTIQRWIAEDPEFKKALKLATDEMIKDGSRQLGGLLIRGLDMLSARYHADSEDLTFEQILRLVDVVARHVISFRTHADIEERLLKLERKTGK